MFSSTSQTKLFNPLLDNPLHGGHGGSESFLEGFRMLVDDVSPQHISNSVLRSPDASQKSHHVKTYMTQTQTPANNINNVTIADKDNILPPMKLIPAFLLVPQEQVEQPGVVHVIPYVSGLPQSSPSPPKSNLEIITRLNLAPLALSKGIITSPNAAIAPVQAQPQAQQLIPQPQYTQQLAPLSFPNSANTSTFPNSKITIQVAQLPVLQDIGLNHRSRDVELLEHIHSEGECANSPINSGKSDSGAPPGSEMHTDTENVGVPQSASKQLHQQGSYTPHPFPNTQKKNLHFHPYNPSNQRQKFRTSLGNTSNTTSAKFKVIEWKNSLTRFWYLLERGGYNKKEHHNLMALLSEMKENKKHVTVEWLKNTKVTECLEKFEKEESLFDYDPLVREVAGSILQFWNKKFPLS